LNESQLIISCQNGKKEAFNVLIRLYYPYVSNFLIKLTSNEALRQDLIQETFVKLIRNIEKYDVKRDSSFSSYLMAIAKNCYMDHLRKNKHIILASMKRKQLTGC
jgi:RNA polymerase sigma-70 factor, ECF subfamily